MRKWIQKTFCEAVRDIREILVSDTSESYKTLNDQADGVWLC